MAPTNSVDEFSKFTGYQCGINSKGKETIKKNFVSTSVLMNKTKKTARETNLYLKKLNNNVLPRCWSADITSDIVNSRNKDDLPKMNRESQYIFKKHLDKNNIKTNEKSIKKLKQNLKSHSEESVKNESYFEETVKNVDEIKDVQEINHTSKLTESIKENFMNNVGVVNIDYKEKIPDEENNCSKFQNLIVQKIPRVDLKPDLVTQKLANIQIKPGSKKTERNLMPNVAYSNFKFETESQICTCQSMIQQRISKNKKVARYEISKILCEMLKEKSSNKLLNDELPDKLQKILINLEETNPLENNFSSQLENLVEQHCMDDLNENILKNKILEIAENVFENENDELSFDQMSIEIERNSQKLLQRLTKIKKSLLTAINPSIRLSKDDYQQDHAVVHNTDENHTIQYLNNNFNTKNFQDNNFKGTNRFISIREYLNQGFKNSVCSKKFENISVVKDFGSKVTLCSKDSIILNTNASNVANTQNVLNDNNITHQPKISKHFTEEIESDGESSTMSSINIFFSEME